MRTNNHKGTSERSRAGCGKPGDDPHHLIENGFGGTGTKGGKPTVPQMAWIARLQGAGFREEVCYGFGEAIAVITDYLGLFN